jgi:hypothetical protein
MAPRIRQSAGAGKSQSAPRLRPGVDPTGALRYTAANRGEGPIMVAVSIQQMAERISTLLGQKYRVSGDLAARSARVRRRVPARVREALEVLTSAAFMAQNPRLAPQIDMEAVAEAYDLAMKHLNAAERTGRRRTLAIGMAASVAFSLLVVAVLLVVVLHWRGYL